MTILSKDSERREQYILHTMTKANKQNMAKKRRGSYEPRPWAMIYSS